MLEVQDVRPDERRGARNAFLTLFGILAAHTLLETARDALFLARLPASQLPWVYLAMAGLAVGLSQARWRAVLPLAGSARLSALLAACSAITFVFWMVGGWGHPWMLRALYIWTGIVGTLTGLQFWIVLGELYTISQAKRLYRIIGLGSLLGAAVGAAMARVMSVSLAPDHLVLAAAVLLAMTAAGPAMMMRSSPALESRTSARRHTTVGEAIRFLREQPYLTRLAGLVLVSTVALTLADYVFKSTVARNIPAAQLGSFFATFYMVLNVLALGAQLVLMGWLMRVAGLHRSLWVLPALVSLGAAGVAFGGGLLAALLLKGADGTLRHSLHRTSTELLFLPIPDSLRSRAKPLIDVVGQRGGQALASVFILGEITLNRGDTVLAAAAALLGVVWIVWAADMRPHYIELFRRALRQGTLKDRVDLPDLDLGSLEALMAALNSADDTEVVAGLDLLEAEGRARLVPALILYHPSPSVVLRALHLFERSGRKDFVPVVDRLLAHADAEVRAVALRARVAAIPDRSLLDVGRQDPSPLVRATALVGLIAHRWLPGAADALEDLMRSGAPDARVALVRAVERQPDEAFESLLLRLAEDDHGEVRRHVAHAMTSLHRERFVPALIAMLAARGTRPDARAALLSYGPAALRRLDEALSDAGLARDTRVQLPRTIALFAADGAARVLLKHLNEERDGMVRFQIIRGLGRIGADHPDVAVDPRPLQEATVRAVTSALRLVHWGLVFSRGATESPARITPGHELLLTLFGDKRTHAVERIFRLLALQYRGEDFKRIYRGVRSSDPKVRAGSRELLENLLSPPLRDAVLALVDEVPEATRLLRGREYYRPAPLAYEDLLALLLEQTSETVRCIAAYHIAELDLKAFRPRLEALDLGRAGLFAARVIEDALRLLAGTPGRLANA